MKRLIGLPYSILLVCTVQRRLSDPP